MFTKRKTGIISLVVALFVIGALAFNSFQAAAIEDTNNYQTNDHGHKFGFWKDKLEWILVSATIYDIMTTCREQKEQIYEGIYITS